MLGFYFNQTFLIAHPSAVFVCSVAAQTELIKATTALETAVFVAMQWLATIKRSSGLLYSTAEELKSQVKKMGGFFQMLIQVNPHSDIKLGWRFLGIFISYKRQNLSWQNGLQLGVAWTYGGLSKCRSDWQVLALSCLSSVYGNGKAEGILSLELHTGHEYMERKFKFLTTLGT